jgi:hypothetical protein
MKNAGSILPILAMITLTTACQKEELASPASLTQTPSSLASRPDVNGDQVTDPTTATALVVGTYISTEVPTALATGQQTSGTLSGNELSTRSVAHTAHPLANQLSAGSLRPDCSFPLAPSLENDDAGSTKRGRRTPPIIPHLED